MVFTVDPQTGKITFGVVADGTNDGTARDIASEFDVSESFRDQFTTGSSWVHQDFGQNGVNTVTNKIDLDIIQDSTNDGMHHDLQTELGGTVFASNRWTLRIHKLNFTTLVTNANSAWWIGISDVDSSTPRLTSQDFIGVGMLNDGTNSDIDSLAINNSLLPANAGADVPWVVDKDYYMEIVRTDDSVTTRVYDDADFSNLLASDTTTGANAVIGLRFLVIKNVDATTSAGQWKGTIDRIQFWNDATQPILNSREWNARYKLELSNLDGGGAPADKTIWIGLGDNDETNGSNTLQDFAGVNIFVDNAGETMGITTPDADSGTVLRSTGRDATFSGAIPSVTTFFVEMLREQDIESFEDDFGNGITFFDDFSTAVNWVQTNTGVSITGGVISGWGADGTDRRVTHDLVTPLSDTKWTIDFEYVFTASSDPSHFICMMTDKDQDIFATSDNDFIGIIHGTSVDELRIRFGDNVGGNSGTSGTGIVVSSSTTHFVRLERISATSVRLSIFSNSARTTHIAGSPQTETVTSTIDELRFIHSQANSGGSPIRTLTGTVDNMTVVDDTSGWSSNNNIKAFPNLSTGVIDWDFSRNGSSSGTSFDLGAGNVSETAWTLRLRFHTDNKDVPAGALFGGVVISDTSSSSTSSTLTDFIGIRPNSLASGVGQFELVDSNGSSINSVPFDVAMTTSITAGSTFYVQIRRLSATSYDVSLYSDAGYSNLLENAVGTTTAGVTGLRFILIQGTNASTLAGVFDGTIDDIQFWNGITAPDNLKANLFSDSTFTTLIESAEGTGIEGSGNFRYLKLFNDEGINASGAIDGSFDDLEYTNSMLEAGVTTEQFSVDAVLIIPIEEFTVDGFILTMPAFGFLIDAFIQRLGDNSFCGVESFTNLKAYWKFDEASGDLGNFAHVLQTDFDDDFSSYTNQTEADLAWTPDGTKIQVNVSTDVTDFDAGGDATNQQVAHDLGSTQSDSAWVLRWKTRWTTLNNASSLFVGIGDSNETNGSDTTQDFLGVWIRQQAVNQGFLVTEADGATPESSRTGVQTTPVWATATDFYWEIRRTSTTSITISVFSDADFVTQLASLVETIPATITGLRFIKIFNRQSNDTSNMIGTVDDIQFWNGVTQVPGLGSLAVGTEAVTGITKGVVGQVGDAYEWTANRNINMDNSALADWSFLSSPTGTWTWNTWVNPDDVSTLSTSRSLWNTRGSAGSNTGINVTLGLGSTTHNPNITIRSGFNNGIAGTLADGLGVPKDGSLHMLTMTMDYAQPNQNWKIYVDGVFTGSISKINDSIGSNQFPVELGRTRGAQVYEGIVDETSVWDRILTPAEITSLFLLGNAGQELELGAGGAICIGLDALPQALDQTQVFTIDAIIVVGLTVVDEEFTVDARLAQLEEFTIDAILAQLAEFTIDARLAQRETFTIDARLIVRNTETFLINALLQALGQTFNFAVDTFSQAVKTEEFTIDVFLQITPTEVFEIDGLLQATPQIPKEFTIDVRIVRQIEFTISAFVEEFGDTERSSVGDLILRVLIDNPPSLTGLEIVAKCVEFTTVTDPTRYDFIGKNSRIKNWIGFLERKGFIEEDDSNPDWYKTNWSILPP